MAEVRNNWEGRSVNELFPLRRFLGSSNHSSVFLTESSVEGFLNAAIKLVPVDPERRQQQLWQWKTASTFSHPHLMRLLDSGQCELDGQAFLFVVMEYAEESLSQILPYRSLGPDEVQELLVPTLDALAFLHREKWIQGQLKPSNFLVVNDHLKLAIDTIRPVGVSQMAPRRPSIYDPPESDDGDVSPASDIWALGVTMTEALTQYPPTWLAGRRDPPTFPTNLPPEFADTVQRCLNPNPDERPTVAQLQVKTKPRSASPAQPQPAIVQPQAVIQPLQPPPLQIADPPPIRADVRTFSEYEEESKRGVLVPALVAVVVVGLAIWGGMKLLSGPSAPPPTAASDSTAATTGGDTQAAAPESPASRANTPPASETNATRAAEPADAQPSASTPPRAAAASTPPTTAARNTPPPSRRQTSAPAATGSSGGANGAVHEEIPSVSASSRSTIHGHVRVAVRVTVDSSGRVVRDNLDNPSSSNYFNRVASEAARKWRFAAADQGSRVWLLHFEFGRDGTTVHAVGPRS
jgi:eukaryotic-like serine/threonine-protein kinase